MQSLARIRDDIRAGRLTPARALATSLEAIAAREAEIGAFEALAAPEALQAAMRRDDGPLSGIAIGVKDIFDTHDLPTGYGSPIYAGHQPRADAAVVAMARRAGATIVGKTVTTEFAFFQPGRTRNPHDPTRTPGGSSSGSAAAVAAGMIPAAIGTQTGGSVIRPAAFCGVAGYKPGFRLFPATGMKTFSWTLDTTGFFAASVADVAQLAEALGGRPLSPVAMARPRIGLYRTAVWSEASPDMRAAIEAAARAAADAGAEIVELAEPDLLAEARQVHATIQNFEAGLAMAGELALHAERMSTRLRETLEAGQAIPPAAYDAARRTARRARKATTDIFDGVDGVDALLTPAAPGAAPAGLETTGDPLFNKLWTLTGNPCVNLPGRRDPAGLPLGLQIVARFGADRTALSVAHWLEERL